MSQAPSGFGLFGEQGLFSQGGGGFGDLFRNILGNPLAGGLAGYLLGDWRFAAMGALASSDIGRTERQNEANEQMQTLFNDQLTFDRDRLQDLASQVPNFFDSATGQIFGPDAGFARPGLRGGVEQFGKGSDIGGNLITLPEFNVGQTALEGFQANLPSLEDRTIDFNPISLLGENQLFGQLESLGVLPETDLSEVLGARLGGIEAAGVGREQQRRQEVAALAPQFGGLENLRGALDATSAIESGFSGRQAQEVTGQTRQEELAAQQFVSEVAGNLGAEEARINTALQQFNRGSQFQVDQTNIGRELGIAQTLSSLEAQAANDPLQRTSFIVDAINRSLGMESNMFGASTTNTLNQLAAQIPLLQQNLALGTSFLPSIMPGQFSGVNTGGGGSSFNIDLASGAGAGAGLFGGGAAAAGSYAVPAGTAAGTAVGLGSGVGTAGAAAGGAGTYGAVKTVVWFICIDGDSGISVPGGQKKLKDIEVGDVVYDWSHNETEVIDKDYGWTTGDRQNEFVRIQTDLTHLICTKDHQIDGRRVDSYTPGERIQTASGDSVVESVEPCGHVSCGDLKLANGGNYFANGFRINSMFKFYGIEKQITPKEEIEHGV